MNREAAKQEIRRSWKSLFYADRKGKGVICPLCGSGQGPNGSGITEDPKKPGNLKCWACDFQGDAIDLIMRRDNCDYNTALNSAAYDLGIKIDPYKPTAAEDFATPAAADRKERKADPTPAQSNSKPAEDKKPAAAANAPQKGAQEAAGAGVADYTAYYEQCARNISDPAAVSYLQARGISPETAAAYNLGYDSAWISPTVIKNQRAKGSNWTPDPTARLILPVNKNHYIARAISPDVNKNFSKMNETGGGSTGIFNAQALYGDQEIIFITEGVFDALSLIECGAAAVALNSTSNVNLFINHLKAAKQTRAACVICLDNDDAGKRAADTLKDELQELHIKRITADISGKYKDPNEALTGDREALKTAIRAAQDRAKNAVESEAETEERPLPGLLTYTDAVDIFKNANDKILEMKSFPRFCKVAKIQTHATVALAADTGAGKSSLAINFLNDLNEEYPCIYINLEMDELIILRRLAAIHSGIELDSIEKYKQDEKTAAAVNISLQAITSRKPLQVIQGRYMDGEEEKSAYLLQQIREIIERSTKGREETTIVIIDHSLLVDTQEGDTSRYDRFTKVSEGLRRIALDNEIIMFVLLQQSRAGKANEEERPKNSSLKESGSWENDATHICFLWYDPTDRKKKLILTKNRGGDGGEFALNYWKKTQTYTEAAEQEQGTKAAATDQPHKLTKREKTEQKLKAAYQDAYINTFGNVHVRDIAEAAGVMSSTVKTWLKEFGCTIDGQQIDPAGIDTEVEYTGFVKLTPGVKNPFDEQEQGGKAPAAVGNGQEVTAQF